MLSGLDLNVKGSTAKLIKKLVEEYLHVLRVEIDLSDNALKKPEPKEEILFP